MTYNPTRSESNRHGIGEYASRSVFVMFYFRKYIVSLEGLIL